jgi:hypothetical protein
MAKHVDPNSALGQYLQQHPGDAAGAAGYLAMHPNVSENQLGQALAAEAARGNTNPTVGQLDKALNQHDSPAMEAMTLGGANNTGNLASTLDQSGLMGTNNPAGINVPGQFDQAAMVANPTGDFTQGATYAGAIDGLNGAKLVDQNGQDMSKMFDAQGHLKEALPPGEHISAIDPKTGQVIGTFNPNEGQNGQWNGSGANSGVALDANGHWAKEGLNSPLVYDPKANGFEVAGNNGAPSGIAVDSTTGQLKLEGTQMPVTSDNMGHFAAQLNGTPMSYDGQSWTAQGSTSQFNWDANSQHMNLAGSQGSVYLDTSGTAGPHLAMTGSGAPVQVDQTGAMHTHIGNTDFSRDANSQSWSAAGAGGQYNWDANSQHMNLAGSQGSVYLDTNAAGGPRLEMSGTNAPVSVDSYGRVGTDVGNQHFTLDSQSGTWSSAAAPNQSFNWDGGAQHMNLAGSQGSVYLDTNATGGPRLEMSGTNTPVQIDQSGAMHTHIGNTEFTRDANSQNWTSASAPNQNFSWDSSSQHMNLAGSQGSVYLDTNTAGGPRLEMSGTNTSVQIDQSGAMHTHVGNLDFTREANSQSWTSASAPNQNFTWDGAQQRMEVAGSQGSVYLDTNAVGGPRLEMAGTNTPVQFDQSGAMHTHIGNTEFTRDANAQSWTSASAPNQSFTWDGAQSRMEVAGSQGSVYLDTNAAGGARLEMSGTNAPVQVDQSGAMHTHIGNAEFTRDPISQSWTSASAPNQSFTWDGAQSRMEVAGSQGSVYLDTNAAGGARLEMAGTNAPVQVDQSGAMHTHLGNTEFTRDANSQSWTSASAPNQSFSWNSEQNQMIANGSQNSVYYDTATNRTELAGTNIPAAVDSTGHYHAQIGNSNFVESAQGTWASQSAPGQTFSWSSEQHQMIANGSQNSVYYDAATNRTEMVGTNTPLTYAEGAYYASGSNNHVVLDQSAHQLVAHSEHFQAAVPVTPAADNSSNYLVSNSGGQLTYNPTSDVINVSGTNVQAAPTPAGDYYVASTTYGGQQVVLPADSNQFYAGQTPVHMTDQGWAPMQQQSTQATGYNYDYSQPGTSYLQTSSTLIPEPYQYTPTTPVPGQSPDQTAPVNYAANSDNSAAQYAAQLQQQQEAAQRLADADAAARAAEMRSSYTSNPPPIPTDVAQITPQHDHTVNAPPPPPPEGPSRGLNSLVMGTLPGAISPRTPTSKPLTEVASTEPQAEQRSTQESLQEQMARLQMRGSGAQPTASQLRAWHKKYGKAWNPEDGDIEEA